MIDASKGFMKDGTKNRLREQDIHKIVDVFNRQLDVPALRAHGAARGDREKNDFNLNLPRYIDSQTPEDLQDIDGHLRGGIPDRDLDALDRYWEVCPGVRAALFKKPAAPATSSSKLPIGRGQARHLRAPRVRRLHRRRHERSSPTGGRRARRASRASPRTAIPRS